MAMLRTIVLHTRATCFGGAFARRTTGGPPSDLYLSEVFDETAFNSGTRVGFGRRGMVRPGGRPQPDRHLEMDGPDAERSIARNDPRVEAGGRRFDRRHAGRNGQETAIQDGTYKDGALSFKVVRERNGQTITTKYAGKVSDDTIKGKIEFEFNGQTRSRDWEAKRAT